MLSTAVQQINDVHLHKASALTLPACTQFLRRAKLPMPGMLLRKAFLGIRYSTWTPKSPHVDKHSVKTDMHRSFRPSRHAALAGCPTTRSTTVVTASRCSTTVSHGAKAFVSSRSLHTHSLCDLHTFAAAIILTLYLDKSQCAKSVQL